MIVRRFALALACLAMPAALNAQQPRERPGSDARGAMGMQQNIAEFVAAKAAELELSEHQLAGIAALGEELRAHARKQMDEMRAEMQARTPAGRGAADRERMMQRRQALLNDAENAKARTLELLTAEQRTRAVPLIEEWERQRPGARMMRRPPDSP
jgi:hypothetical protein